ncbi:MAG TPA: hypothetical protein VF074_05780, partial [Pyrinomonadaceae bacterium]
AVDGRVDEAIAKFKKSEDLLATGLVIFTVFVLGALVSLFLTGVYPFAISIGLGLIISVPIVFLGLMRVDRVRRLLDPGEKPTKLLKQSDENRNSLPPAPTTDRLPRGPVAPDSVTEQTTLNLKHPTRR